MRIVDRKTFLAMPPETIYAKYESYIFGEMLIKGTTILDQDGRPFDWFYQPLTDAVTCQNTEEWMTSLEDAAITGSSLKMDFECEGRDGCFESKQLFTIFERNDVRALIERLQRCES